MWANQKLDFFKFAHLKMNTLIWIIHGLAQSITMKAVL